MRQLEVMRAVMGNEYIILPGLREYKTYIREYKTYIREYNKGT